MPASPLISFSFLVNRHKKFTKANQTQDAVLVGQRQLLPSDVGELEGASVISGSTVAAVNKIVGLCENGSEGLGTGDSCVKLPFVSLFVKE